MKQRSGPVSVLREFLKSETAGGVILMAAAALALAIANSPLADFYFRSLHLQLGILPVLDWINDALMALFFLLVGLEVKRELTIGQLSTWKRRTLPGLCALGGMIVPAAIYIAVQGGNKATLHGWAIPAATDIAFALGVITLLSSRVPVSLRIFLAALAIIDDLGAVIIIAIFYAGELQLWALAGVGIATLLLVIFNLLRLSWIGAYMIVGSALWWCMLQSGVHATLAGVIIAFCIPIKTRHEGGPSPLRVLEHELNPLVSFAIVPLFGFANAGVALSGVASLLSPIPLGIALGLFAGKQLGVLGAAWLSIKAGIAELPTGANWRQLYGTAVLCGIGFTMSLFIGLLAFDTSQEQNLTKIGVLAGSLASAILGALVLNASARRA
ncbi:MAG TPA: Na+/H+ antiporter NhaA [Rhizomicrobium sp.]|nr:Na+/H+ antiporter NhaA [Rhizomicrobium sp.]